jgi:type II secretory pathway predicted ATPase ExeA
MPKHGSSIAVRAFGENADPGQVVAYQSHNEALRYLAESLEHRNRIALLKGPTGSGKTTVVNQLAATNGSAAAIVDANHLLPRQFLTGVLAHFEIRIVSQQDEQLLQAIDKFVTREARQGKPPLLVIDNVDQGSGSLLSLVNWLAALEAGDEYALKIVLTCRERITALAEGISLRNVARRHPATWSMNPLSNYEARLYLRTRFAAAGGQKADTLFSRKLCDRLYELAEGWPGPLNEQARDALQRADELHAASMPRIIVSRDGETIAEHILDQSKYAIGRSELADILIEDAYASKLHAMLQVYSNAILLSDLNSTNGTIVNSKEVRNTILRSNDIIKLGRHRIKIENAPALSPEVEKRLDTSDTMTIKNLEGLRRARALRNIATIRRQHAS